MSEDITKSKAYKNIDRAILIGVISGMLMAMSILEVFPKYKFFTTALCVLASVIVYLVARYIGQKELFPEEEER